MCGIAGIWKKHGKLDKSEIISMSRLMVHRGPDDVGHVLIDSAGKVEILHFSGEGGNIGDAVSAYDVALANRRLAIIDLSPRGHQPMTIDGCTIVYNGEIYNYIEIRGEIEARGLSFFSSSDTEVLLRAYLEWGIDCLSHLNGMFAFAIWDARKNRLFCARDRLGIKPFYYYMTSDHFIFASEIRSILAVIPKKPEINEGIVYDFLSGGWLDHTRDTFFTSVCRLKGGHYLIKEPYRTLIQPYWQLSASTNSQSDYSENINSFRDLFSDSIRLQMRSDVPVGCCLSGGMDSSAVASVASALSPYRIKAFTARYQDPSMDEWHFACKVACRAPIDNVAAFAEPHEFWDRCSDVVWSQEEPFGGPGVFAQWILMRTIQSHQVRVTLDGQGGDELLCGYAKYFFFFLRELWRARRISHALAMLALATLQGGKHLINFQAAKRYLPGGPRALARRLFRFEFYLQNVERTISFPADNVQSQQISDIQMYGLPALLRYEDKNSMSHSVESRVPFLDHRLVEFCVGLPAQQKLIGGRSKRIMRDALDDFIPRAVLARRTKLGFGGTFVSWVNTLSPKLEKWLESKELGIDRYLHRPALREQLRCRDPIVFRALILERWMERFRYA
jgi:asparagine synthase (glutamine-hydrolysing)